MVLASLTSPNGENSPKQKSENTGKMVTNGRKPQRNRKKNRKIVKRFWQHSMKHQPWNVTKKPVKKVIFMAREGFSDQTECSYPTTHLGSKPSRGGFWPMISVLRGLNFDFSVFFHSFLYRRSKGTASHAGRVSQPYIGLRVQDNFQGPWLLLKTVQCCGHHKTLKGDGEMTQDAILHVYVSMLQGL